MFNVAEASSYTPPFESAVLYLDALTSNQIPKAYPKPIIPDIQAILSSGLSDLDRIHT